MKTLNELKNCNSNELIQEIKNKNPWVRVFIRTQHGLSIEEWIESRLLEYVWGSLNNKGGI